MFSINSKNDATSLALAESSNKTSRSNDFAGELASVFDRITLPKSTNAKNRSKMTLIYGSSSQNSEEPPTTSSRSACTENHSNSTEDNPLHLVAASHRFKTVACPFSAEDDGFPRHIACADSNMDLVQKLIDNGTNFDMKDEHGNTARHIACADDNMDIVQKLLKRGTDFDMKDESGDTSLHVACLKGRTNIVKELLKSNANVDVTSRITKHHCISHVGMVIRMLLKYSSTVAQILTRKKYWRHIAACRMF